MTNIHPNFAKLELNLESIIFCRFHSNDKIVTSIKQKSHKKGKKFISCFSMRFKLSFAIYQDLL